MTNALRKTSAQTFWLMTADGAVRPVAGYAPVTEYGVDWIVVRATREAAMGIARDWLDGFEPSSALDEATALDAFEAAELTAALEATVATMAMRRAVGR